MESHVIPKFFGKEIKKRSKSQTLVNAINPQRNPKPQDITKAPLLCRMCELQISKVETAFRNNVMPANKSLLCPIPYSDWMLKFTVSISWRVLTYLKYASPYTEREITSKALLPFVAALSPEYHPEAEQALEIWRAFLLNERHDVSKYEQHVVVLGGKNFPHEYCNTLAFTFFQKDGIIATHTLLGQLIVIGFIRQSENWKWKGTKIDAVCGHIGIPFTIPLIYGRWLADMFTVFENVSLEDWKQRRRETNQSFS